MKKMRNKTSAFTQPISPAALMPLTCSRLLVCISMQLPQRQLALDLLFPLLHVPDFPQQLGAQLCGIDRWWLLWFPLTTSSVVAVVASIGAPVPVAAPSLMATALLTSLVTLFPSCTIAATATVIFITTPSVTAVRTRDRRVVSPAPRLGCTRPQRARMLCSRLLRLCAPALSLGLGSDDLGRQARVLFDQPLRLLFKGQLLLLLRMELLQ
eukprot:m.32073 g.32073  ORF g.32073 m.32073 type:complete len:211 (-) comp10831_c0_seq1:1188-1820(-)